MHAVRNVKKVASLGAICLQSTLLAVVLDLSSRKHNGQKQYNASSAVIITELAKLVLSVALAAREVKTQHSKPVEERSTAYVATELPERRLSKATGIDNGLCPTVTIDVARRRSTFVAESSASTINLLQAKPVQPDTEKWPSSHKPDSSRMLSTKSGSKKASVLQKVWAQTIAPGLYKMALPAILFSVQNILIYVAARNLSMAVFQITFQLKSLITALCAVFMLGRRYTPLQWLSLLFLGLGVACIQLAPKPGQGSESSQSAHSLDWRLATVRPSRSQVIGLTAVIVSCFASAIAATYFELLLRKPQQSQALVDAKMNQSPRVPYGRLSVQLEATLSSMQLGNDLKVPAAAGRRHTVALLDQSSATRIVQPDNFPDESTPPPSLWIKNIQLAMFSLICTIAYNYVSSSSTTRAFLATFFEGFNAFTWIVIAIQAIGGLLTALVIKHADNVAKGFALSTSIVLTLAVSILCFNYHITAMTAAGAAIVLVTAFTFERYSLR